MPVIEIVETITSGSLLLAIPLAFLAGLVSFLSPCVLPLVPGYLSYITGVAGARATAQRTSVSRSRAVWGSIVFVSGFSVVFISYGALFGGIGQLLLEYQRTIQMIMGVVVVILGLGFWVQFPQFNVTSESTEFRLELCLGHFYLAHCLQLDGRLALVPLWPQFKVWR